MKLAVITTLFNEADSVERLMRSLAAQTRPPDQIVVADAGSTDGTREKLDRLAARSPRLVVVDQPGNRSAGRNAAIRAADAELIACIDGGCTADPGWLQHLSAPLEKGADWVAGFYRPEGSTRRSTCIGLVMVYVLDEVDPETFLPSGRSMAFRKEAWARAGGFPEMVDFAEDTLFGEMMLAAGYRPHFAEEATVAWTPPTSYARLARTLYAWGRGDGEAGLRSSIYRWILAVYAGAAAAVALTAGLVPRAVPLALVPLVADTLRRTRFKYRWAEGTMKYLHIPVAHVIATCSALAGFLAGRSTRRSRERGGDGSRSRQAGSQRSAAS